MENVVEILEDDDVYGGTCGLLGARPSKAQKCAISFSDTIVSLHLHSIVSNLTLALGHHSFLNFDLIATAHAQEY